MRHQLHPTLVQSQHMVVGCVAFFEQYDGENVEDAIYIGACDSARVRCQ